MVIEMVIKRTCPIVTSLARITDLFGSMVQRRQFEETIGKLCIPLNKYLSLYIPEKATLPSLFKLNSDYFLQVPPQLKKMP